MDGKLRGCRLPALLLLILCAAPSRAAADEFVCSPIARGDTATTLARRLIGSAAAAYSDAFQIRDPARRMFVPKSQYQRLKPHWQACVTPPRPSDVPVPEVAPMTADASFSAPVAMSVAAVPAGPQSSPNTSGSGLAFGVAGLLMLLMAAAATWLAPRPIPAPIRHAADEFIAAFERPLVDPTSATPPIQSRVRFVRRRQQLEISIAPGPGRRYPNLTDHKKNVEYDVNRVMRVLESRLVLRDSLRAHGKWVVIPIGFVVDVRQGRSPSS